MATFESLPLELVLPIVREAVADSWTSTYDTPRLLILARVSPPFEFCAKTLLHVEVVFRKEEKAQLWLATRDPRYVVKSLVLENSVTGSITAATALRVIHACSPALERFTLWHPSLYVALIHESNLKNIRHLSLFSPPVSPRPLSFTSLRTLEIVGWPYLPLPFAGTLQLLRASPVSLTSLSVPEPEPGSEVKFAHEFRRISGNLTSGKFALSDVLDTSPLVTLFQDCASLESLDITAPDPASLPQLLAHLPSSSNLRCLRYESHVAWFLDSYPDAADNVETLLSLPQLAQLKWLSLDLLSDDGEDPDEEMEDPPGDEDGRFVGCLERWAAKGIDIDGAYQWGWY